MNFHQNSIIIRLRSVEFVGRFNHKMLITRIFSPKKIFIKWNNFKVVTTNLNKNYRFLSNISEKNIPQSLSYLTKNELAVKEMAEKMARDKIAPLVRKMEKEERFDDSLLKMFFENGLMGIEIPEDLGGLGSNFTTLVISVEEFAKVDACCAILIDLQNTLVNPLLLNFGTDDQKNKYLPELAKNVSGSFCLSEASSGSDAYALKTIAKKDGNDYVINGSKMWISGSDMAELFFVMANADPSKGYRGITCFIVERNTPGLIIGKPEKKLGMKASGTCAVHFDNVRIPKSNILGEFGMGYKYAAEILNIGRIAVASQMVGLCQGCMDSTIPYLLERKQFGKSVYSFQGMQFEIADMATQLECARLLTYNASRLKEAGLPFVKQAAMAKYYASELAQRLTSKCIDWMGGVGFTEDFPQEKFYRDCKVGTIYEGTSNMQLMTIAKYIEKQYSS